ncbi:dTDP-4-dehydrorhamnose 3,5-epimerase [[Leptolyngbya] sp. PCC 7376]|uniref:dTDP-4-dehydrorhamnose 3,5-epimerase n=1 Tax=[Leptolyngbya] sp. PCC 7376 TaxID=111781 RepID=UPI00029F094D|nr:dTDP-4-dehydrorhamnose 3,5-epimerase [[Leptolyngbya] sp. PCC 7376]AFY36957.1 dTDP-4-dehydrorhamnose 3,5-epimerase [[Leptolyngbya] sp. PCC 7376]
MKIIPTNLPDVLLLEPKCYKDDRGFFLVSYQTDFFQKELNLNISFVQDNHSRSCKNVLRGLHFQTQHPQGKLVRVVSGEVYDVAVDIRENSRTFGQWFGTYLSAKNQRMLWVPPGFAHGFLVTSEYADFLYKVTDIYSPKHEQTIHWSDPEIGIEWPLNNEELIISEKDSQGMNLSDL